MAEEPAQSYANHVRQLPRPYFAAGTVLALNVVVATAQLVVRPDWLAAFGVLVALALFGVLWFVRTTALVVQDRVVRLEERLRLERLLPEAMRARIGELGVGQLAALRFASDGEVAELVRQVLDENLRDRDAIKRRIRSWRPDDLRV